MLACHSELSQIVQSADVQTRSAYASRLYVVRICRDVSAVILIDRFPRD